MYSYMYTPIPYTHAYTSYSYEYLKKTEIKRSNLEINEVIIVGVSLLTDTSSTIERTTLVNLEKYEHLHQIENLNLCGQKPNKTLIL